MERAEQAGLCEVVVRSNSTADDIFKVFQNARYRNRIAIFHYGGHANGYQLLLESAEGNNAAADAGGLAGFLAQQQGLQLVFLNGCSTQQQTQGLLDANVSAVISTSRSIDDQVATDFASQFYQGLAGGATIRTAYHEAEAAVQTATGGNTRDLYFGDPDDSHTRLEADRWPWNLYLREGSESADQWNLPEAVHDPLFGLPPLPEQDLPETPYRHLNWFTRKDAEIFFGRGHQIRELYDRLTAPRTAPIILFYGQSGVGKSSILDAGLIPRLEQAHEVRYLRRTEGGLLDTLQLAFLPEVSEVPIETAWRAKEAQHGKPLIVFLDQVEELYTRPIADLPDELDQLLRVVKATFSDPQRRPQGKLVLGFRKEWLAELESHLAGYELPRTKVFLEPLDRRGIIEVVRGPTRSERLRERYGLTVEDGLAEIIADDLLEDRGSAIAPTLQILLTKMWTKVTEENYERPQFTKELYRELKRDGILLGDFLDQQMEEFRRPYPDAVDSGLLLDILELHTTQLGTGNQCLLEELQCQYAHLDESLIVKLRQQCQDLHLLTVAASNQKESTKTTRLAHDTLAPLVRERFEASDKPGQRARRILESRKPDWNTPLNKSELEAVKRGIPGKRTLTRREQELVFWSTALLSQRRRRVMLVILVGLVIVGYAVWWGIDNAKKARLEALVDATPETAPIAFDRLSFIEWINPFDKTAAELIRAKWDTYTTEQQLNALYALAKFGEARPDEKSRQFLIDLIVQLPPGRKHCELLVAALEPIKDVVIPELQQRARTTKDPVRRVRYTATLLALGDTEVALEALAHQPDPTDRTRFIESFASWHANLSLLPAILNQTVDPAFRSGMFAAIGSLDSIHDLSADERADLLEMCKRYYEQESRAEVRSHARWSFEQLLKGADPTIPADVVGRVTWLANHPGIHTPLPLTEPSPAALRIFDFAVNGLSEPASSDRPADGHDWFVNRHGLTMVRIPAGKFVAGELVVGESQSQQTDRRLLEKAFQYRPLVVAIEPSTNEREVAIEESFFMSDREIEFKLFLDFLRDEEYPADDKPSFARAYPATLTIGLDLPAEGITWVDAVLFCNWLSYREGREPCYQRTGEKIRMRWPDEDQDVQWDEWRCDSNARGYRLPTEAEWEYACRAGTTTRYNFGDREDLLSRYGNFHQKQSWRGGHLIPNAWGLFDMHGNVWEWCWDEWGTNSSASSNVSVLSTEVSSSENKFDASDSQIQTHRAVRGGCWINYYGSCGAADRGHTHPLARMPGVGFRIVCR